MDIDQRSLRQRLDAVPLPIRTKMGLDKTTEEVQAIKDKFHIDPKEGIIARLILRLMIEDLAPQYFAWEIKEYLGVDPETAKKISEEVRDKVLKQAKEDFKKVAIDISLIGNLEEPPQPSAVPAPAKLDVGGSPVPTAPIANIPMPKAPPIPTAPIAAAKITPAPFMMHQEASVSPLATGSDFKLSVSKDIFKSAPARPMDVPRPPKAAELEIGKAPLPPKPSGSVSFRAAPGPQSRVIHYTDLRTAMVPGFGAIQPPITPTEPRPVPAGQKPSAPINAAPAPIVSAPAQISPTSAASVPTTPTPIKPPKVVNFGPEEVK